jgi:mediator of RNA polymerase II transcription subunit 7
MPGPPMHYIRHYTEEAVRRGTAPRPPPPIPDTYSMFGITINNDDAIIQTLESQVRGGGDVKTSCKFFL